MLNIRFYFLFVYLCTFLAVVTRVLNYLNCIFKEKIYTIFTCNMLLNFFFVVVVFNFFLITIISRRHVCDCRLGPKTVILFYSFSFGSIFLRHLRIHYEPQSKPFSWSDGANAAAAALCTAHLYKLVWRMLKEL